MARMSRFPGFLNAFHPSDYLLFLLTTILISGLFVPNHAEERWIKNELNVAVPTVCVDHWSRLQIGSSCPVTDFLIEIEPSNFIFKRIEQQYMARYYLEISIIDESGIMVATKSHCETISYKFYEDIYKNRQNRLHQLCFNLPPGIYRTIIRITDQNINKTAVLLKDIHINSVTRNFISLSDILFLRQIKLVNGSSADHFRTIIVPFPNAVYGEQYPLLFCYFEIYIGAKNNCKLIDYTISVINENMKSVIKKNFKRKVTGYKIPVSYRFSTMDLEPGYYHLRVEINHDKINGILSGKKLFHIRQNPIDIRFKSYAKILKELQCIAGKNELQILKNIPKAERNAALHNFWKRHDPTPMTPKNELMDEYYRRIEFAKRCYWNGDQDNGRFTDRGKIYLKYGRPDFISRRIEFLSERKIEIWDYPHLALRIFFIYNQDFKEFCLLD